MIHNSTLTIHTDGGARGNPGPAAIGVVIDGASVGGQKTYKEYIGVATNNVAEYRAVILALIKAKELLGATIARQTAISIVMDSELICKQFSGEYRVKDYDLKMLFAEVMELRDCFKSVHCIAVRREQNQEADRLVNEALDEVN